MRFVYRSVPNWPPLAWLAKCRATTSNIDVFVGPRVDIFENWFCEAAWAGDYISGNFDETDIVAGSGARIRDKEVIFVSSGSIHDRLHTLKVDGEICVSNSLICLLAVAGAAADLNYVQYQLHFASFRYGIGKAVRNLPTSAGYVQLTYFDNLVWNGSTIELRSKPDKISAFKDFCHYRNFLATSMQQLYHNVTHSSRQHPYRMLCTMSNGYDSPTVAALASEAGCKEAITIDVDRKGLNDSGEKIAAILGLRCHSISREAWISNRTPEIPFIACSGSVGDLVFKGMENHLSGKVLLTGLTDTWVKKVEDTISDGAGLGLTEYRLWAGFIHSPVTMWGGRHFQRVNAINNSPEMKPWDLDSPYSRPICRRILEEAGVPRNLFGMEKHGVSVVPPAPSYFLSPSSREDFLDWIGKRHFQSKRCGSTFPSPTLAKLLDRSVTPLILKLQNLH